MKTGDRTGYSLDCLLPTADCRPQMSKAQSPKSKVQKKGIEQETFSVLRVRHTLLNRLHPFDIHIMALLLFSFRIHSHGE